MNNYSINLKINTTTSSLIYNDSLFIQSLYYLDISIRIKVIASLIVLFIGLVGHILTIYVFSQKRFRINSSNVFLLCLAINDGLYLIIHFFEETIIVIKDINDNDNNFTVNYLIKHLNLIDKNELSCQLINYFRYVLRFISAYIIVSFTIQRLCIVYMPIQNRLSQKKSAWKIVGIIVIISIVLNSWAAFSFEIRNEQHHKYCTIKRDWSFIYFYLNAIFIIFIVLIPILVILIINICIIIKTKRDDSKRKLLQQQQQQDNNGSTEELRILNHSNKLNNKKTPLTTTTVRYSKPHIINIDQAIKRDTLNSANNMNKLTRILIFVSFSYVILNLPHLFTWWFYIHENEPLKRNFLFTLLQFTEILYMTNYGIHFYLYCITGTLFRKQLKYSNKNIKNFYLYD